jgi:hypothetical protein
MGRPPSLGAAQRRPTRARIILNDPSSPNDRDAAVLTSPATPASTTATNSPNSVSTPQFPRRAPRTGTAYQHKVPAYEENNESTYDALSRPAPLLMSRDVPHETVSAVEQSSLLATTTTTGMYYYYLSETIVRGLVRTLVASVESHVGVRG